MLVFGEIWNDTDRKILKAVVGKTVDEARSLFPDFDFRHYNLVDPNEGDICISNRVTYILNPDETIKNVAFG
jgi:hypothetical protein